MLSGTASVPGSDWRSARVCSSGPRSPTGWRSARSSPPALPSAWGGRAGGGGGGGGGGRRGGGRRCGGWRCGGWRRRGGLRLHEQLGVHPRVAQLAQEVDVIRAIGPDASVRPARLEHVRSMAVRGHEALVDLDRAIGVRVTVVPADVLASPDVLQAVGVVPVIDLVTGPEDDVIEVVAVDHVLAGPSGQADQRRGLRGRVAAVVEA